MRVTAGDVTVRFTFNTTATSSEAMGWTRKQMKLVASRRATKLEFTSEEVTACGPALDDVKLELF